MDDLLRANDAAGSFLNGGPAISGRLEEEFAKLKPEATGERIGHYILLQRGYHF